MISRHFVGNENKWPVGKCESGGKNTNTHIISGDTCSPSRSSLDPITLIQSMHNSIKYPPVGADSGRMKLKEKRIK